MPTAKKTASGSWRCRVYSHTEVINGKEIKKYKSITVKEPSIKGKKKCEKLAADFSIQKTIETRFASIEEGIDRYIASKENVLSPSTIRSYKSMADNAYDDIKKISMELFTPIKAQEWINKKALTASAKTIKNQVGLLTAVFDLYGLQFPKVTLPKRKPVKYNLPSNDEINTLLEYCDQNDPELGRAVLLGAFCGLRRGEILALKAFNLEGNTLTIENNLVRGTSEISEKAPKTYTSTRVIEIPSFVADELRKVKKGKFVDMNPEQLTNKFVRVRNKLGLSPFRFHDLRHWCASNLCMIMPLNYVEQFGGWKPGSTVLKSVYINAIDEATKAYAQKANEHFESIIKER